MKATQTTTASIKPEEDIKRETEDKEEVHHFTPRRSKRRKTAKRHGVSACCSSSQHQQQQHHQQQHHQQHQHEAPQSSRDAQTVHSAGKRAKAAAEVEVLLEERQIKAEPEENWRTDGEDSDSGPEFEAVDFGTYCDYSEDEACNGESREENGNSEDEELRWQTRSAPDTRPPALRFRPARPPGPAVAMAFSRTPLSLFQLFFSAPVLRTIVENTNKNGTRLKETGQIKRWTEIAVKDLYVYLTTVLFAGLVKLQEDRDYWRESWPYGLRFPGKTMSKGQFYLIKRALSLCDPEKDEENECNRGSPGYDKLFKIKPFFTEMVNACKSHFQPHSNICVNERKITKNSPITCGFSVFALADSQTGYTWNLHIYTGKTVATRGQSSGYTAVMDLLSVPSLGTGYTLYTDSLFSSLRLFTEIQLNNIGCCGILNKHQPGFPKTDQNDFPSPASRGDIRWLRKDRLLFVKWMDTREVSMCSTVHEAFTGQVIRRPVREAKGMVAKQFSCPDAVADFNRNMIVVDKTGPLINYGLIPCVRVRRKWHKALFYYFLDLAVVNSFILYQELAKLKGNNAAKLLMQKQFREELCKEMLKFGTGLDPNAPTAPSEPVRCLPLYYEEGSATNSRRTCRWCSKKTPIFCVSCQIPLCIVSNRNCFYEWHMEYGKVSPGSGPALVLL